MLCFEVKREREIQNIPEDFFPNLVEILLCGVFSTKGAYERFQSGNTGDYRLSLDHSYAQKQM